MTWDYRAHIPGTPVPASRPRVVDGRAHTATKYAQWKRRAALTLRIAHRARQPMDGSLHMIIVALWPRPERARQGCAFDPREPARQARPHMPDWDNVGKAVSDALVQGGVIVDDSRVTMATVVTAYAAEHERHGIHVYISQCADVLAVNGATT